MSLELEIELEARQIENKARQRVMPGRQRVLSACGTMPDTSMDDRARFVRHFVE
jgi:hypothetical protein